MSQRQARTRLTRQEQRDETRERLLSAAEDLFAETGIGATSLEDIAAAAGFTRGALHSNFGDRDGLVFALLERHQARSMGEAEHLLAQAESPQDFLSALLHREHDQPARRVRLSIEYVLYASREPVGRGRLKELNRSLLEQMASLIRVQFGDAVEDLPIDVMQAAKILLALDEGFALLRLIDPETYPIGIWGDAIVFLNDATIALMQSDQPRGTQSGPT